LHSRTICYHGYAAGTLFFKTKGSPLYYWTLCKWNSDTRLHHGPWEQKSIDVVAKRTVELIVHVEQYRRSKGYDRIAYEVGTEEVHGGLADMKVFNRFSG